MRTSKNLAYALGGIVSVAAIGAGCDTGSTTGTEPTGRPPQAATAPTSRGVPGTSEIDRGAAAAAADANAKTATATIEPSKAPGQDNVAGTVTFTPAANGVKVHAEITGLTPNGKHGFHIHEKGDLSAPDLMSAGSHFNPGGHKHGGPDASDRHGGDLGNLEADGSGKATYDATIQGITLGEGANGIVGKSVIVHEKADDLKTDPSGNSGARIGGGVIKAGS
jgi:superoxide dismutase, Cu-Zn family